MDRGGEKAFVLVHQMGKVGSTAIGEALRAHPELERWQVQQTHTLNSYNHAQKEWFFSRGGRERPPELGTGAYLLAEVLPTGRPVRVISPFRDPVARNLSSFFHSLDYYLPGRDRGAALDHAEVLAAFYARMKHEVVLKWYFDELLEPFGIDVYAEGFDFERGWKVYRGRRGDALVFPFDLEDGAKARAIAGFLGIGAFAIGRTNEAAGRADARLYKEFVSSVRLEESYVDWMYSSRFVRQFFTGEQIEGMRARWLGEGRESSKAGKQQSSESEGARAA